MDRIIQLLKAKAVSGTAAFVAAVLREDGPSSLEALAGRLGYSPRHLSRLLSSLEAAGLVAPLPGGRWAYMDPGHDEPRGGAAQPLQDSFVPAQDNLVLEDKEKEDFQEVKTLNLVGHPCPNPLDEDPEAPSTGPSGRVVEALRGLGVWSEVYSLLRPYFPTPRLWIRYLESLAAILAELGPEGPYGIRFALAQLARGMAHHAPAYFRAVLQDQLGLWRGQVVFSPPSPKPTPPLNLEDGQEVAFLSSSGALLVGRFSGWTGHYAYAFVEVEDGRVYRVPVGKLAKRS